MTWVGMLPNITKVKRKS